jgi:hypothetical protein
MSSSSQLTPNGLDLATEGLQQAVVSLPDDILDNYKEAVINYSKVETRLCLICIMCDMQLHCVWNKFEELVSVCS